MWIILAIVLFVWLIWWIVKPSRKITGKKHGGSGFMDFIGDICDDCGGGSD